MYKFMLRLCLVLFAAAVFCFGWFVISILMHPVAWYMLGLAIAFVFAFALLGLWSSKFDSESYE